jgi:tryptophan synthase beta subunit
MLRPNMTKKLTRFITNGDFARVSFVETQQVSKGVECDVYMFIDDTSRDLAIVTVVKNHKTPLQRVVSGTKTIEGFVSGTGTLSIGSINQTVKVYSFNSKSEPQEVIVRSNQTMQWHAAGDELRFYEICEPPYTDGRFETLS